MCPPRGTSDWGRGGSPGPGPPGAPSPGPRPQCPGRGGWERPAAGGSHVMRTRLVCECVRGLLFPVCVFACRAPDAWVLPCVGDPLQMTAAGAPPCVIFVMYVRWQSSASVCERGVGGEGGGGPGGNRSASLGTGPQGLQQMSADDEAIREASLRSAAENEARLLAEAIAASSRAELDRWIPPSCVAEGTTPHVAYLCGVVHGALRATQRSAGVPACVGEMFLV